MNLGLPQQMTIEIKTSDDIKKMRTVCSLAAQQLQMIEEFIKPGVTTGELDRICHDYTVDIQNAIPAPLNYKGYPKSICTSVNHVVCHGIPSQKYLKRLPQELLHEPEPGRLPRHPRRGRAARRRYRQRRYHPD